MDFTDTEEDVVALADDLRDDTESDTLTLGENDIMPVVKEVPKELPHNDADLHFLGKTFLHTSMRVVFDLSVVLHLYAPALFRRAPLTALFLAFPFSSATISRAHRPTRS